VIIMGSMARRIERLGNKKVLASWVAVVATLLLGAEILWTVSEIWPVLEMWVKVLVIFGTFLVVVMFGWRRSPEKKAGGII